MLNRRGKLVLFLILTAVSTMLLLGLWFHQRSRERSVDINSSEIAQTQTSILRFLDRSGWKPKAERVAVEKLGDNLGLVRAVLLRKTNDGLSVPGMVFMVGQKYMIVGRLFDVQSGQDLSPKVFGKVPITFDLNRLNLNEAHKRGSERPKVVIVEYGDYGCQSCAKLEKVWQPLLDNFPDVQLVYKHFPLSEGSRYLAEAAEAVAIHDPSKFWEIHRRFMAAEKSNWDETETKRFAHAHLSRIGLDPERIEQLLKGGEPGKRVSRDISEFPVTQTPTLVVNSEVVVGAVEYPEIKSIVDEKLKALAK